MKRNKMEEVVLDKIDDGNKLAVYKLMAQLLSSAIPAYSHTDADQR